MSGLPRLLIMWVVSFRTVDHPSLCDCRRLVGCVDRRADLRTRIPPDRHPFVLRPFREDDFDAALALTQTRPQRVGWSRCRPPTAREWRILRPNPAPRESCSTSSSPTARATSISARRCSHQPRHDVAEVGCCLVPAVRGRGIATEALTLLTDWALRSAPPRSRAGGRRTRERPSASTCRPRGLPSREGHRDARKSPVGLHRALTRPERSERRRLTQVSGPSQRRRRSQTRGSSACIASVPG